LKFRHQTQFQGCYTGFIVGFFAQRQGTAVDWHPGCMDWPDLSDLWEIARFSGRIEVKTATNYILLSALILSVLAVSAATAQQQDVHLHWAPSPVIVGDGIVLPEAVRYEIWLKRGGASERKIDTVSDTTFTLSADPWITQRVRVRGIDAENNKSVMSEWSDPIYFETDGDIVKVPVGAQLKANYPNPFNPETRIVYGIPEDIKSSDVVRLEIFTVKGTRVRVLQVNRSPGWHEVVWNGKDDRGMVTSTGMYVTRLVVGNSMETGKMTMVK